MERLEQNDSRFPQRLRERLQNTCPDHLMAWGNLDLLGQPLTALFCSTKCPGHLVLRAFDRVAQLRDAGQTIISGFHSPMEKEFLAMLLRGTSPIVICPARVLPKRIPPELNKPLADGRLLILSCFPDGPHRPTTDTAHRRNEFVAALATEIIVFHATPGGLLEAQVREWRVGNKRLRDELWQLRQRYISAGGELSSSEEIDAERRQLRGERQ